MHKDERDLLSVLKAELEFLEKGGYARSSRESWRQPLIFEDSPSCINWNSRDHAEPCSSCVLFQLVPPEFRGKQIPCRYIPLNAEGDTLYSLHRSSTQFEAEGVFGNWLRNMIATVEKLGGPSPAEGDRPPAPGGDNATGTPMSHASHPKCANPACTTEFRWLEGGKFFRFRSEPAASSSTAQGTASPVGIPAVQNYWLCGHCSHVFTLAFEAGQGVMLRLLWPELLLPEFPKQLTAG
jgi:hypothetical protein